MADRVIRADDLVRVPWKNGGGTTAEIAAFPEGASFESFGWRVSMADVASDGPFSSFPGIDRTLTVMTGAGIELETSDGSFRLDRAFPRLSFPGDDSTFGRLLAGPIRDLNVMTRRGTFRHRTRIMEQGVALLAEDTCAAFIAAMDSGLDATVRERTFSLQPCDTLVLDPTQDMIQLAGAGRAVLVEIAPVVSTLENSLYS